MASFTDSLIGFNPYVSTVPVDDYTRVGMIKQQQYDQGVQKVQGYIDSVAGLEVAHPEQKEYLQQRVGQLQNQVSGIVSKDFSNQQIVNSVGSLATKMSSDPLIQNAVASTQRLKENNAKMKQSQDQGKSSPANEYAYQKQVQDWLTNKDVTSSFNGQYVPYTDVNKKLVDAFNKEFGEGKNADELLTELPYVMDNDGKQVLDKEGRPILNYDKIVQSYKGISSERVRNLLEATLDENDKRQLAINGTYEYRGYGKQDLKNVTDASYKRMLDQNNDAISGLLTQRNAVGGDPAKVAQIDDRINQLKRSSTNLQDNYKNDIGYLDKDPEGYKASLYKTNWESQLTTGLSYAQYSTKHEDNPGWKNANTERKEQAEFDQKAIQFQIEEQRLRDSEIKEQHNYEIQNKKLDALLEKEGLGGSGGGLGVDTVGVPQKFTQDATAAEITASYYAKVKKDSDAIEGMGLELLAQTNKNDGFVEVTRTPQPDGSYAVGYEWKREAPDHHLRTDEEMEKMKTEARSILNTYENADNPDNRITDYKARVAIAKNLNDNQIYKTNQISRDTEKASGIDKFLSGIPTVTLTSTTGTKYSISPHDVLSFKDNIHKVFVTNYGGGPPTINEALANRLFVTPKDKYMWDLYKSHYDGRENPGQGLLFNLMDRVGRVAADPRVKAAQSYAADQHNARIMAIDPRNEPEAFPIREGKQRETVENVVGNVIANNVGLGDKKGIANTMMGGKVAKDTKFSLLSKGNDQFAIRLINADVNGGSPVDLDLTSEQAQHIFGSRVAQSAFAAIDQNLFLTRDDNSYTTNVQGKGAATAMPLINPNLKDYTVKYDVEGKDNAYQIRVYARDKKTGKDYEFLAPYQGLVNKFVVTNNLSLINDNAIAEQIAKIEADKQGNK